MAAVSVILFAVSAVFWIFGILIRRGKTDLIHDYHQSNIKESEKKAYAKAFASAVFGIAATLTVSGTIALFGDTKPILIASLTVLFAGLVISLFMIGKIQKKYNGKIL